LKVVDGYEESAVIVQERDEGGEKEGVKWVVRKKGGSVDPLVNDGEIIYP
jgi:hypothetical protein